MRQPYRAFCEFGTTQLLQREIGNVRAGCSLVSGSRAEAYALAGGERIHPAEGAGGGALESGGVTLTVVVSVVTSTLVGGGLNVGSSSSSDCSRYTSSISVESTSLRIR
jgi:hypothetical protein